MVWEKLGYEDIGQMDEETDRWAEKKSNISFLWRLFNLILEKGYRPWQMAGDTLGGTWLLWAAVERPPHESNFSYGLR